MAPGSQIHGTWIANFTRKSVSYEPVCPRDMIDSGAQIKNSSHSSAPRSFAHGEPRCHAPCAAKSIAKVVYVNTFRSVWYVITYAMWNPDSEIQNFFATLGARHVGLHVRKEAFRRMFRKAVGCDWTKQTWLATLSGCYKLT